jgi:hypothetical protein
MATTEEAKTNFRDFFGAFRRHYDGYSSTHPDSSVQRVYSQAYLNETTLWPISYNFSNLIKGASFVASNCKSSGTAVSIRNNVVTSIRDTGFRVDGLGSCLKTNNTEGIAIEGNWKIGSPQATSSKLRAIRRYMFHLAFENAIEPGYVTEKPFDALIAGKGIKSLY